MSIRSCETWMAPFVDQMVKHVFTFRWRLVSVFEIAEGHDGRHSVSELCA